MPYKLLASRLVPTYGREHPEQPATVLPLIFRLSTTDKNVKCSKIHVSKIHALARGAKSFTEIVSIVVSAPRLEMTFQLP